MEQKRIETVLGELTATFRHEYAKNASTRVSETLYMPKSNKEKWWCTCGTENGITTKKCRHCGIEINELVRILNKKYLTEVRQKSHVYDAEYYRDEEDTLDMVDVDSSANIVVVDEKKKGYCSNCGKKVKKGSSFCPHCGKAYEEKVETRYCSKCGQQVEMNLKYCSNCGERINKHVSGSVSNLFRRISDGITAKRLVITGIGIVAVVALVIAGTKIIPKFTTSMDEYLAEAEYEKAYEKAGDDEEREEVLIENIIARLAWDASDNLKDPTSFSLLKAYWAKEDPSRLIVLVISGTNSYGAKVSSYYLFTKPLAENEYKLFGAESDLSNEKYSEYDDEDEKTEKFAHNITKSLINEAIETRHAELDIDLVKRINALYEEDKLRDVELLDDADTLYPKNTDDKSGAV